ncbi:hypothetical protein DBV15_01300, partial [Temnothorax longispinosus]
RGKSPLCGIGIGLFSDTRVFIKSRSQSPRFQGTTDKKPVAGLYGSERSSEMHGVPAADSATRKRTVSFLRRTSTWGCKVRNEIRDKTVERTHVQPTRGHLRIDRSYTIYIHITVYRHSPGTEFILILLEYFLVDAFHPPLFSFFPPVLPFFSFFWLGSRKTTPVECTLGVRIAHVRDEDFRR